MSRMVIRAASCLGLLVGPGALAAAEQPSPLCEAWDYTEPMKQVAARFQGRPGVVLHVGDTITYHKAYRQWALEGEGKTDEDQAVLAWMHCGANDNSDGWWLCHYTAGPGRWADEVLDGSSSGAPSLESLLSMYQPQIVVVMVGTSDVSGHRPTAFYRADMQRAVEVLLGRGVIPILSTLPPHPKDPKRAAAYNEAIRQLAASRGLPLIDFEREILGRRPEDFNGTLMARDDVQPSAAAGAITPASPPTPENLRACGYLLRGWLSVRKIAEVKRRVLDALPPRPPAPPVTPPAPPESIADVPPESLLTKVLQGNQVVFDALIDPEFPEQNFGRVGDDNRLKRHDQQSVMLMRFVLTKLGLPPGARVLKASVVFYVWDPSSGQGKMSVAAMGLKTEWKEREATWKSPMRGKAWKGGARGFALGLDTGPPGPATIIPPEKGADTVDPPLEYRLDVTELVRGWLSQREPNYGLAIVPMMDPEVDEGRASRLQLYASEHRRQQWAPKLEVVATTAPEPKPAQAAPRASADERVRLPAVADVWLSGANAQEENTSAGKSPRLKLKTIQELALIRFDAAAALGREVLEAKLFVRRASRDKLRYLRVSTVNQDWVEGHGSAPYGPADGATFLYADGTPGAERSWAWPGSCVADVIMTSGNSLGSWGARKELAEGWISLSLTPELIYAMAVGDSDGLAVMDGGNPAYENNYLYSVQAQGSAPYIEVRLGKALAGVPAAPVVRAEPAPERAHLASGAIRVSIAPAEHVFCWRLKLDGQPVARWRVKHPAPQSETVFYLEDLAPGKQYRLEVTAVSPGGKLSPAVVQTVAASAALPEGPSLGKLDLPKPAAAQAPQVGPLRVWALPGLVKISPTSGEVISADLGFEPQNAKPAAYANPVWDGREIRLFGARGEYVSYQLCLENSGKIPVAGIRIRPEPLRGPNQAAVGLEHIELYANWYAKNRKGQWQPAYCVPITRETTLAIPDPRRALAEQQNQTVYVDVYIPKDASPGNYAGRIVVEAGEARRVALPVSLEVFDFLLPDRLSFWPELNGYHLPKNPFDAYRLAHQHRCVLNCKGWSPAVEGSGKEIRVVWDQFDAEAGPLLDGTAFARNRRSGVPVECMYLPFCDSWPTPLSRQTYAYEGFWPDRGDDPKYLVEHYLTAPYIGDGLSRDYKEAFLAVQRQFIEHFRQKGYTRTEMQCLFDGKITHRIDYGANMWWTTDEPLHWDDWLALQFFCHLWTVGRGKDDPRLWPARADISRPQWQGRVLNRIVDVVYFGAGGFSTPAMVRRARILGEETGLRIRSYGTASSDDASNTQSLSALVQTWANGAEAFLPWQTLGSEAALDTNDAAAGGGAALLVPGDRLGQPVLGDMRLKALRDGQQLIEYLTLLGQRRNLVREQLKAMLAEAVPLDARAKTTARLDDAAAVEFGALSAWQIAELRRRVAKLILP